MRKLLPLLLLLFALPVKAQTYGQAFFYSGGSAGGSGTVTSIATTAPITGGTITHTGTIACATCVTSAAALTSGQFLQGSGLQASAANAHLDDGVTTAATITSTETVSAPTLISTVAIGTAPFTVTSTTNVPNLNASTLSGVAASSMLQTGLGATQTFQCTGATSPCWIFKASATSGRVAAFESSGGTIYYYIDPAAVQANNMAGGLGLDKLVGAVTGSLTWSASAPTIAGAGCGGSAASVATKNGTSAFKVNVGTSNTGTCTVTMPTAATDWVCSATDITTTSTSVSQTKSVPTSGHLTTQITLQNYTDISGTGAWTDSDVIAVSCFGE